MHSFEAEPERACIHFERRRSVPEADRFGGKKCPVRPAGEPGDYVSCRLFIGAVHVRTTAV